MKPRYAIHVCKNGTVDWVGEIAGTQGNLLLVEVIDAVCACCGLWSLSGEVKIEPTSEWRFFVDKGVALSTAHELNRAVGS